LTHAFLWEYSYKRLKLAQILGRLGIFLTLATFFKIRSAPFSIVDFVKGIQHVRISKPSASSWVTA
jgi:hypothetical protein